MGLITHPILRPERGLLQIRKHFELSINLRPVQAFESLLAVSPLKEEVAAGVDMMIVRELTGGLYFGEPSYHDNEKAVDTLIYNRDEIERVVIHAFELAKLRRNKVTSVDKANVLESSKLWREIVEEIAEKYPEVKYEHMLVDAAAMKLITYPSAFDVIVTENMFGDILSDEASVITGSLGMLTISKSYVLTVLVYMNLFMDLLLILQGKKSLIHLGRFYQQP